MRRILLISLLVLAACKPACNSMAECKAQEQMEKDSYNPVLVSEINGTQLYRVRDDYARNGFVWFSKSGTQTDECHLAGKVTVCEEIRVPNSK